MRKQVNVNCSNGPKYPGVTGLIIKCNLNWRDTLSPFYCSPPSIMLVLFLAILPLVTQAFFTPTIVDHGDVYVIRTQGQSTLYGIPSPGYARDILLIDLHAPTRFELGYDYGRLLVNESLANWNALISTLNLSKAEEELVFFFLDYEWDRYLSVQV